MFSYFFFFFFFFFSIVVSLCSFSLSYDAAKANRVKELQAHHEAVGERKAFKNMSHAKDMFDAQEHTAASMVYTWDDGCKVQKIFSYSFFFSFLDAGIEIHCVSYICLRCRTHLV